MLSFITREQDYALRITAYLAGLEEQISVKQLSSKLEVSGKFASRIVHKLKTEGILKTRRGVKGGVCLNGNAKQLTIYDVLNAIGFENKFNQCLAKNQQCTFECTCKFHRLFAEQENKLLNDFKEMKISEFIFDI